MSKVMHGCAQFDEAHDPTGRRLRNTREAAKYLGLARMHSVVKAVREGSLQGVKVGQHWYFSVEQLDAYLRRPSVIKRREDDARPKAVPTVKRGRLPMEPFIRLATLLNDGEHNVSNLAMVLGVDPGAVYRAMAEGVTERHADRWSIALGVHPAEVWGMAWWALAEEREDGEHLDDDGEPTWVVTGFPVVELDLARRRHPSNVVRTDRDGYVIELLGGDAA